MTDLEQLASLNKFKKNLRLKEEINPFLSNDYFIQRKLLRYRWNLSELDLQRIFAGNQSYHLITGFGVTGHLHLGSKLILNETRSISAAGIKASLFLSFADTKVKGVVGADTSEEVQNTMLRVITHVAGSDNVKIFANTSIKHSKIYQKIKSEVTPADFVEVFKEPKTKAAREAIIDMTATILGSDEGVRLVVLLGIDELDNAAFVKKIAEKIGLPSPGFLFNQILPGYDFKKMGKTRPEYSFIISNDPQAEFSKLKPFLRRDNNYLECPCYHIHTFSEFGTPELASCNKLHPLLPHIIKQECSIF